MYRFFDPYESMNLPSAVWANQLLRGNKFLSFKTLRGTAGEELGKIIFWCTLWESSVAMDHNPFGGFLKLGYPQ